MIIFVFLFLLLKSRKITLWSRVSACKKQIAMLLSTKVKLFPLIHWYFHFWKSVFYFLNDRKKTSYNLWIHAHMNNLLHKLARFFVSGIKTDQKYYRKKSLPIREWIFIEKGIRNSYIPSLINTNLVLGKFEVQ